jgi:hypothetical protein
MSVAFDPAISQSQRFVLHFEIAIFLNRPHVLLLLVCLNVEEEHDWVCLNHFRI